MSSLTDASGWNLVELADLQPEEITAILERAAELASNTLT